MIDAAKRNQAALALDNISLLVMDGRALRFDAGEFDVVLLRHLSMSVKLCGCCVKGAISSPKW
jgi:hypothetical protein